MDPLDGLNRAANEFDRRLSLVTAEQWELSTPCPDWTVRLLVRHVVAGNRAAVAALGGARREEFVEIGANTELGADPAADFAASSAAMVTAFGGPGAFDGTYEHPMGTVPGPVFAMFRMVDVTAHAWDLARAIGADETLDAELVDHLVANLAGAAPALASNGRFGEGKSPDLPADAPPQTRFLDLLGRRP